MNQDPYISIGHIRNAIFAGVALFALGLVLGVLWLVLR